MVDFQYQGQSDAFMSLCHNGWVCACSLLLQFTVENEQFCKDRLWYTRWMCVCRVQKLRILLLTAVVDLDNCV